MSGSSPPDSDARTILRAVLGVARGQVQAIGLFGDSQRAFIISLIPLLFVPMLYSLVTTRHASLTRWIVELCATIVAMLVPPVVTHALAVKWGRESAWLRFATAYNWCELAPALLAILLNPRPSDPDFSLFAVAVIGFYVLWLHWFLARHGLGVTSKRAALLALMVPIITNITVFVPLAILAAMRAPAMQPS